MSERDVESSYYLYEKSGLVYGQFDGNWHFGVKASNDREGCTIFIFDNYCLGPIFMQRSQAFPERCNRKCILNIKDQFQARKKWKYNTNQSDILCEQRHWIREGFIFISGTLKLFEGIVFFWWAKKEQYTVGIEY